MPKLGFITAPVDGDTSEAKLFSTVKAVGLPYLELTVNYADYRKMNEQDAARLKTRLSGEGVSVAAYCIGGWGWSDENEEVQQERAFEFAKALGAEVVVGCTRSKMLPETDRLCNRYGIRFAIEPHWNHAEFRTPWDILRERRHYSLMVGANIDTGHFASVNVDAVWALRFLHTRFHHVHLKDIALLGAHNSVPLGEGTVNIRGFLEELRKVKYEGRVSIETEGTLEAIIKSRDYCRSILDS